MSSEHSVDDGLVPAQQFALGRLFLAIEAERERQDLSWAALSRHVGVATSTIRRLARADDAEADGVLALIGWLEAVPEDYVNDTLVKGRPLPSNNGGIVRVDMELVASANNEPGGARGRTRTTIQRLVAAAQGSTQPVASLTRLSQG